MKKYFIALPEGHDESTYNLYSEYLKGLSGFGNFLKYIPRAKYLVSHPRMRCIQWGTARLEEYRKDPNCIEVYLIMENV